MFSSLVKDVHQVSFNTYSV